MILPDRTSDNVSRTVMYVLISICYSQNINNISCCSGNDLPDHSCQLTNGTCKLTHPCTGVSNITIRGQGHQYTHICHHMNVGLVFSKIIWHWTSWLYYRFLWSNWQWRNRLDSQCNQVYHLITVGIELQRIVLWKNVLKHVTTLSKIFYLKNNNIISVHVRLCHTSTTSVLFIKQMKQQSMIYKKYM